MADKVDAFSCMDGLRADFTKVNTLSAALKIANEATFLHRRFQHYTSVPSLVSMILGESMWLTRGDSISLDDSQESKKFGSRQEWGRTYIGCFSHFGGESAAMWRLYCKPNAFAIRVSASRERFEDWVNNLRNIKSFEVAKMNRGYKGNQILRVDCESVCFQDLVYLSVKGDQPREKTRANQMYWFGDRSEIDKNLSVERRKTAVTGLVKDSEWGFELESRLLIKINDNGSPSCAKVQKIKVPLLAELIKDMSFTFSPWANDDDRIEIKKTIECALAHIGIRHNGGKFYKSTLTGALQKWAKKSSI